MSNELPIDYLAVELLTLPDSGFTLGRDRLGTGRLADEPQWHDVTCNLTNAHFRRGGKDSPASSAIEAGYLSMTSRNDLNPLENIRIHPGVPVRVRDKRLPEATGTLFTGALDDVSVRFDKVSGDYWVTLSASDLVRNLRRIGVRGDLGNVDGFESGPGSDRIAELLDRSGVPRSINHRVGIFRYNPGVPTIGPSDWVRFGPTPAGVTQRPLAISEQALWIADMPSGDDQELEATARERGITTEVSGLLPGRIYRYSVALYAGANLMAKDDDATRYVLWTDSGAESHSTASTVNGIPHRVRLEVIFRATRTVHQLSIGRDYTGKLGSESGHRVFEAFHISSHQAHVWDINGGRPVQSVAYDSTLFNHLTLAADSARYRWHVNPFGVVHVAPSDTPGIPRLHFTDRKYEEHRRNLIRNPAMVATSGTVEVRRNHVRNPIGPAAPTSGYDYFWRSSPGDHPGEYIVDDGMPAYETIQDVTGSAIYIDPNQNFTANVGDTIRLSIDVKTNSQVAADGMRLRITSYSGAANDSPSVATPIPVNEWTRLSLSGVVTAAPDGGSFRALVWPNGSIPAGDYILARRAVVEIGTSLPADTDFFDGATTPDPDLTASWTGATNASASVLTGLGVANLPSGGPTWTSEPYQITEPDGSKAARFITGTASTSGVPVSNVSTPIGVTRTVLFQVRPSVNISARPRVGNAGGAPLVTLPAGQWTTLRVTGASIHTYASQTGVLIMGSTPGNFIDIRYAMLTDGEYDGPYRDGDSGGWQWEGTPNASASRTTPTPVVPLVPYTDITEAYNTAGTINTLEVDNKGRTPSTEVRGGWVTSDTETTFGDEWSRDRFDEREASMDLQLPEALVAERVKEIFDKYAEPSYSIQDVTFLAKHYPDFAALDMPAVNVERNGVTATYQVAGIEHEITPNLHRITYRVERA